MDESADVEVSPAQSSARILGDLFLGLLFVCLVVVVYTASSTHLHNLEVHEKALAALHKRTTNHVGTPAKSQYDLKRWLLYDLVHGVMKRESIMFHGKWLSETRLQLLGNQSSTSAGNATNEDEDDEDEHDFVHVYSYGLEDANNSAVREIEEADRLATEPDDVEAAEEERAEAGLLRQWRIGNASKNKITQGPGDFVYIEADDDDNNNSTTGGGGGGGGEREEEAADGRMVNVSNVTGAWVWCRNASDFGHVGFAGGRLRGVGKLRRNETLVTMRARCVQVDGPGFDTASADDEEEEEEEEEAAEEDEPVQRQWDEPFMTYEPHPSSVGWDKKHWHRPDWVIWLLAGPAASALFAAIIVYLFGPLWGMAALAILAGVDALTFYWNW